MRVNSVIGLVWPQLVHVRSAGEPRARQSLQQLRRRLLLPVPGKNSPRGLVVWQAAQNRKPGGDFTGNVRGGLSPRARAARHGLQRAWKYGVPLIGVNADVGLNWPQSLQTRISEVQRQHI
jgi:hypothetical protein